jgi:SSS family solute:Na+ symporter
MNFETLFAIALYFSILLVIGLLSYKKHASSTDFILGGRSLNYYVTALSAHASDMSSWLLMAYPAVIMTQGVFQAWTSIGLIVFMYLNWHFIAPKIRVATEHHDSLTLSSYFESRFKDNSGLIRILSAVMAFVFFTIYISAGLVGLGLLFESLFDISYTTGIIIGIAIAIIYPLIGGYVTLAWTDLFQGLFLLAMVVLVPFQAFEKLQGWGSIVEAAQLKNISLSLLPDFSMVSIISALLLAAGWGLGYFGQPHIITKFMGIHNVQEMHKSKNIGIGWLVITLFAATCIGLIGIAYFNTPLVDSELVFVNMVKDLFSPFIASFVLCAILAAVISVMDAQILVLTSHISEDFYKKIFRKNADHKELVLVARIGILLASFVAFIIAAFQISSIYNLVLFAWTGLGCSFGPLVILSLFSSKINKYGAIVGILFGGSFALIWPYFNNFFTFDIPAMVPGFILSITIIYLVSLATEKFVEKSNINTISDLPE